MSFYKPFVEKYSKLCAVVEDTESENPYSTLLTFRDRTLDLNIGVPMKICTQIMTVKFLTQRTLLLATSWP